MYRLISTRITSTFFFLLNQVLAEKVVTAPTALTRLLITISLFFLYVTNANKLPDRVVAKLNDDPISQLSFI